MTTLGPSDVMSSTILRRRFTWAVRRLLAVVVAALLCVKPSAAQDGGHGILGSAGHRTRVIGAVWGLHPFEPQFPELGWASGFGLVVSQSFVGTFINSYGDRAFIGGVERYWATLRIGRVDAGVGYRAGLVTGYDERLFEVAKYTPVLPFGGLLVWTDLGPFGVDVMYVYKVITLEASLRF